MRSSIFIISYIFFIQLLIIDSECSEKLFSDGYYVTKRVKRRANNITRNDTIKITNILLDQLEMMTTTDDDDNDTNTTAGVESKDRIILNQDDILGSKFQTPEFGCNKNHSDAAEIYCYGDILHVVMMLGIYKDSKTFVDKPLKKDPDEVIADFQRRFSKEIKEENREEVEQFIEDNFGAEGEELDE